MSAIFKPGGGAAGRRRAERIERHRSETKTKKNPEPAVAPVGDVGRRTAPPLVELQRLMSASRAVETETETAADLAYLRGRGTSLGGLLPKCTVIDDDGMLAIGKFPSVQDERAVTKGEVLAMTLAKAAGLP